MATVPRGRAGVIAFFRTRIQRWTELGPAIGLGLAEAQALADAIEQAKQASERNRALQSAARAAAKEARRKENDLRRIGGQAIASIRARAGSENDPGVLTLAELPAIKDPRPTPAPSKPTNVRTSIDHEGAIVIAWDATRPRPHARAFTRVQRMLDESGTFELIGTSGTNEYRDDTVPQGTRMAAYRLVPVRGELVGASAETVVVRLGAKAA